MDDFANQYNVPGVAPSTYPQASCSLASCSRCSENAHFFDCKHEIKCDCGQTERLPLQLDEGI